MRYGVRVCVIIAMAGLAGCPDGSPSDPPVIGGVDPQMPDPFFVDINNAWTDRSQKGHSFVFMADPTGKVSSATLSGFESLADGSDARELAGMFKDRTIEFTSALDDDMVAFTGTFRNETTMEIKAAGKPGLLTLEIVPMP